MSVNEVCTMFRLESETIYRLRNIVIPDSTSRLPLMGKMVVTILLPPPKNDCPWSFKDFWSCILDNLWAMERRYPMFNSSAALLGKNSSDIIASSSYNSAPTERQQFLWGLNKLHSINCIVLFLNWVLHSQSWQYVVVYNFANMHSMSHRSDYWLLVALVNI